MGIIKLFIVLLVGVTLAFIAMFGIGFFIAFKGVNLQGVIEGIAKITELKTEVIASNLTIPWSIGFLPNGNILVTERPGNLAVINENREIKRIPISGVYHIGEGGLLGLALHPDFSKNNYIYLYYTYKDGNKISNKVVRFVFVDEEISQEKTIISSIPGSNNHNGGRIAFGPDGYLYITTGDATDSKLAQDTSSLAGKILRITDEGKIPEDNPFGNPVYSYGHRNPQGLAWDNTVRLWITEHGRSGLQSGFDELNLVEKGENYGWPEIQGDETKEGMKSPVIHSGSTITWAPAGSAIRNKKLYFGGLRGQTLYEYDYSSNILTEYLSGKLGRIREVFRGPGNELYVTTSNKDGRGIPEINDDKIIKVTFPLE